MVTWRQLGFLDNKGLVIMHIFNHSCIMSYIQKEAGYICVYLTQHWIKIMVIYQIIFHMPIGSCTVTLIYLVVPNLYIV